MNLTEDSFMKYGKYGGYKLKNIPSSYLLDKRLKLYTKRKLDSYNNELLRYINQKLIDNG